MASIVEELNKAFESRVRLGVMSVLMVNQWVNFNTLKAQLNVTDGNLASHLSALERYDYIRFKKEFVGRRPRTSYQISTKGREAFRQHLDKLEELIKQQKK